MRKLVFFLLTIAVSIGLISCMKEVESSFGGTFIGYVTKDAKSDLVYAQTFSIRDSGFAGDRRITSPKLEKYPPGYFTILTCHWTESNGRVEGVQPFIYNVQILNDFEMLDVTELEFSTPPTMDEKSSFNLHKPLYDKRVKDNFFDNKWLFPYSYKIKKGETVGLAFFFDSQNQPESKSDQINVIIDVVLTKTGTPSSTDEELVSNFSVVDFSSLLTALTNDKESLNKLTIKFRFNKQGTLQNEPYVSEEFDWDLKN